MASNIVTAHVSIKGTRPLLFHRFGPDALPLEKQERAGVAGNDPTEWRRTALVTPEGQLYIEPAYVFAALREGGKYTRRGKGSIQPSIAATLQVVDDRILIDRWLPGFPGKRKCDLATVEAPPQDQDEPVFLDIRGVRNPSTKARNVRYRVACSKGWACTFTILFDKTIVSRQEIESVTIDAGRLAGIGNGRAIGFGRFEVVKFQIVD